MARLLFLGCRYRAKRHGIRTEFMQAKKMAANNETIRYLTRHTLVQHWHRNVDSERLSNHSVYKAKDDGRVIA